MPRRRISDYLGEEGDPGKPAVDVDVLIKKTVEATVAELVKGIIREIREMRESIEEVKARLEQVERKLSECRGPASRVKTKSRGGLADKLAEILAEEGYVLASASRSKLGISPYRLRDLAEEVGARIVELGHDYAVMDPQAYREFILLLSTNKKRDPQEAAKAMGRYKELFEKMREAAIIYYDAKRGTWRIIE